MAPNQTVTVALLALLVSGGAACASRDVPQRYPESSAASPSAHAAPPAVVTRALHSEPPLPGTASEGWEGLASESAPDPHANHEGHGHGTHGAGQDVQPGANELAPTKPAHDHSTHQHGSKPQAAPQSKQAPGEHHEH